MWDLSCDDPIDKLYYSAGYELICIHCGLEVTDSEKMQIQYLNHIHSVETVKTKHL